MKLSKTSKEAWKSITIDFITKLLALKDLMTKVIYNSILVITDWLTKYMYFILYQEALIAKDFTYVFMRTVFVNHEMLREIILDQDKLFISKF
jgi:hypothetical protein